nr:phospholipase-like, aminotransferase-like mobile domain protein [Tanacetum cinerariifolium]
MLQKQKISDNDHYDLPLIYSVNGHTLYFGRREFCLISGFKFGFLSFRKFREGDITFRDCVFPEKIGDSIRVCLLLSLEVIFMGHELGSAVDDVFLRMVEDLDVWNDFPWGEHMWRELYGAIRNVNLNHQQGHHKALEMNPNFVLTYSLSGFLLSFKKSLEDVPGPSISHSKTGRIMGNFFPSLELVNMFVIISITLHMVNFGDLGDKYWSDKDGEFFSFNVSPNQSADKDPVNELVDALDDLVDKDDGLKVQKLEAENKRLAEQRRIRFHKMKEQENNMKSSYFSNSTHMKLALENYGTNKRKFANVLRPTIEKDTYVKVLSIDTLKKQNNVLDQYMIEKCQQLKPWGEEDALIGLDDKRLGWLLDDVNLMSFFYVTDEIYPMAWWDVEQVFIPINKPKRHWSLAQFHIQSGNVTFYDTQKIEGVEYRPWYLKMRSCLETKLPVLLHRTGVFVSKGIDLNRYSIKSSQEQNVPQHGGLFGDYGVFVCLFLYRLAHGIPLSVEDPIHMAFAYREKMVKFHFNHKIICPS